MSATARQPHPAWLELAAARDAQPGVGDASLTGELLAHLDLQLVSARRMLQIVLEQASAIRRRAVRQVVAAAGELQVEMHRRELIERDRLLLMERAARQLGVTPQTVGFTSIVALMDVESAEIARSRNAELRELLTQISREHTLNRALLSQELAFLDHLLGLAGTSGSYAAHTRPNRTARRRVFDLEA